MTARLLLSIAFLVVVTTFAVAFNPAPVFREPPKPSASATLEAMQGTWSRTLNTKAKGKRAMRTRIKDKTWTNLSPARQGADRPGLDYEIHLDTTRTPVSLDLVRRPPSPLTMKGIIKVEGGRLIFCYAHTDSEEDRPKAFTDTAAEGGRPVRTMTLIRDNE